MRQLDYAFLCFELFYRQVSGSVVGNSILEILDGTLSQIIKKISVMLKTKSGKSFQKIQRLINFYESKVFFCYNLC